MSRARVRHVSRTLPPWATADAITLCGHLAGDADMTPHDLADFIRTECRGSYQVAYATVCVTCVNAWTRTQGRGSGYAHDTAAARVASYLTEGGRLAGPERRALIDAEVEALAELTARHEAEFRSLVEVAHERAQWRAQQAKRRRR